MEFKLYYMESQKIFKISIKTRHDPTKYTKGHVTSM